ncbi:MAG: amidase [Spirochaetia bacterium]|nr:amidase [Spirochaetia bacterium]
MGLEPAGHGEIEKIAGVIKVNELCEMGISDLKKLIENRKLSSLELVDFYLDRIEKIDKKGPELNSVLEINPDARDIARKIDNGECSGILSGIPILIKGNIGTCDSMTTAAGSLALAGNIPAADAEIVSKLRNAGAIILGKTNLSEWANFRSTKSSSGWSSQGGQTKNPYILDRSPCGSSSGSGVAVSANLCAAAIGTETDGSIICPSSSNGIVGIKPTLGLVSQKGIIPISHSQDTAGPMTRSVGDAALVLSVIAGTSSKSEYKTIATAGLEPLAGKRIGVVRNYFGINSDVDGIINESVDLMKEAGTIIVDTHLETKGKFDDAEFEVLLYEFKDGLNRYLETCMVESGVQSLSDLISYNKSHHTVIMPWFSQEILEMADKKSSLTDRRYRSALRKSRNLSGKKGIDALITKHYLDALIAPSGSPAWKTDLINGDHFTLGSSSPAAAAGYPNITVPAGFIHGLPVGISFFGKSKSELKLIQIAAAYEKISGFRRPPVYKKS